MARPPKPTAVHETTGAYNRNPNRRRDHELDGGRKLTVADVPATMRKRSKECWLEILETAPGGAICWSDRIALEITAELLADFRAKPTDFPAAKLSRLEAMIGKFGMTPSDRAKLNLGGDDKKEKDNDPWGEFKGHA